MQLVKHNDSSHWYELLPSGKVVPQYEATLREARKHGYFISPTSIERDVMANPTLQRWIKNEIAKAFVSTPRGPAESDENYAARCLGISDSISQQARERGTAIHDAIERWQSGGVIETELQPYVEHFGKWFGQNFTATVGAEVTLADADIGVAGRTDLVAVHKDFGITVIDFKTQNIKAKPSFYNSFPRQLSFYAQAYAKINGGPIPRIMSVIIDSNAPAPVHAKLYTHEEQRRAYKQFLALVWLWQCEKDYYPGRRDLTPSFQQPEDVDMNVEFNLS